jgi:hypothetical protein
MSTTPIYVVVCENSKPGLDGAVDDGGPIVWETYTRDATLHAAQLTAGNVEKHGYGACRVARLVFEDDPGFAAT